MIIRNRNPHTDRSREGTWRHQLSAMEIKDPNGILHFGCNRRCARHGRALLAVRRGRAVDRRNIPVGTLIVNVTGCFVIGFFAAITGPDGRIFVGSNARQFVMIGICGGYTTFSSFSLQTLNLMNNGEWFRAGAYIGLSVLLCLIGVWAGVMLAGSLNAMKGI